MVFYYAFRSMHSNGIEIHIWLHFFAGEKFHFRFANHKTDFKSKIKLLANGIKKKCKWKRIWGKKRRWKSLIVQWRWILMLLMQICFGIDFAMQFYILIWKLFGTMWRVLERAEEVNNHVTLEIPSKIYRNIVRNINYLKWASRIVRNSIDGIRFRLWIISNLF